MKEEELTSIFRELKGSFDTKEPLIGHRQRFLGKLNSTKQATTPKMLISARWWRPYLVAASVALLCMLGLWILSPSPSIEQQVAHISPEISQTEFYFANLIEEQVRQLENESSPETRQMVEDTMRQLEKLERNYKGLEQDLLNGGNSKLILSAMITNFQTRIDLLASVLEKIDNIKNLKSQDHENYSI